MKLFGMFGKSAEDQPDSASAVPDSDEPPAEDKAVQEQISQEPEEEIDRGATMTDVIQAVTDQFALINAESDADLEAVGAALCQLPEQMPSLDNEFASFRHEVLHAILTAGDEAGMADRAVILNRCLVAIEHVPDLAEHVNSLKAIASELRASSASSGAVHAESPEVIEPPEFDNPTEISQATNNSPDVAENAERAEADATEAGESSAEYSPAFQVIDGANVVEEGRSSESSEQGSEQLEPDAHEDIISSEDAMPPEGHGQALGTVEHADRLITAAQFAQNGVREELDSNTSESAEGHHDDDMFEFVKSLANVRMSCLKALESCFDRELATLDHYRDVCVELELSATRLAESKRCITFIDAGLRGEPLGEDYLDTQHQWLCSLTAQLASVTREQGAIALEKAEQIKGQISEIQLEADQAAELIKKLGAETLEPPSAVLQSLTSHDFGSENSSDEVDYEDSIDQYIDWMKRQREAIREQRRRIEELDKKMADAERASDGQYSGRLEPIQRRKDELTRNLKDALQSASKDAEETEALLDVLSQDASTLMVEYGAVVEKRMAFAANVEDSMASTMISLGKVLDEANFTQPQETPQIHD